MTQRGAKALSAEGGEVVKIGLNLWTAALSFPVLLSLAAVKIG